MAAHVVCLSGAYGSGFRAVARTVADELGFTVVDEEIVLRAAHDAGVDPAVIASVEARRSILDRALDALSQSSEPTSFTYGAPGGALTPDLPSNDALRDLIRAAIEETAARGNVVIVSHAASHALASVEGALRVLVTSSLERRQQRYAEEHGMSAQDVERALADSDRARADYLKRFYGLKREEPTQYDLVLNTDRLPLDRAAELVVLAAR